MLLQHENSTIKHCHNVVVWRLVLDFEPCLLWIIDAMIRILNHVCFTMKGIKFATNLFAVIIESESGQNSNSGV